MGLSLLLASGSISSVTETGVHRSGMQKLWCLISNLLLAVSQIVSEIFATLSTPGILLMGTL